SSGNKYATPGHGAWHAQSHAQQSRSRAPAVTCRFMFLFPIFLFVYSTSSYLFPHFLHVCRIGAHVRFEFTTYPKE
ncbi:MAG: hypothetical protein REI95_08880, partial [Oxalicibacterium faecigallinarum]|uniref:hypothetical protein n=1 Tax=Oxalicibacterium faecigallinarum TaxID=573741 RepID=UPI002808FBAB